MLKKYDDICMRLVTTPQRDRLTDRETDRQQDHSIQDSTVQASTR